MVLTYMATLRDAITQGILEVFELPEWEQRLPQRILYVTPSFIAWADETPELHDQKFSIGRRTLFEHLSQMLCDFRCDQRVLYGDIKRMIPTAGGIWRIYPPGLRVYGWCPNQFEFAAVTGALEADTKKMRDLNNQKRNEVRDFLRKHGLMDTVLRGDFLAVFPHKDQ
jgi:hypothetical protein